MNVRRVVLIVTCLVVAGLAGWFLIAKWDQGDRVATALSALTGVAAVGVAIWAGLRSQGTEASGSVRVSRSGDAVAGRDGSANSGVRARLDKSSGRMRVDRSGDAQASAGGETNTGVRLD